MQDPATGIQAIASDQCSDCGIAKDETGAKRLTRGRCHRCYQRHIYALKKAGAFQSLNTQPPVMDRFLSRIDHAANGCMHWTGTMNHFTGYGLLSVDGRHEYAHRLAYTMFVGPIPDGMHIDHVCHNRDVTCVDDSTCQHRRCVNPEHLQAVTCKVNILRSRLTPAARNARKTHCKRGHEFTPENTRPSSTGGRACRACHNLKQREYEARRRAEKKTAA